MDLYDELNKELTEAGVPQRIFMGKPMESIDVLVNTEVSSKPYKDILLSYLDRLSGNSCEMVVRALTEKDNKDISERLVKLFDRKDLSTNSLWAVGNALNVIKDKSKVGSYFKICKRTELGMARSELIKYLGSFKTTEIYNLLIDLLSDETVKAPVIEAIGRSKRPEAIELLKSLDLEAKSIADKNRLTAVKKLEKAAGNNG